MKMLQALCVLLATTSALVIKRSPQDGGQTSSSIDAAATPPSLPSSSSSSSFSSPASPPASSPPPASTTSTAPATESSPPSTSVGGFDFSQCPSTSSCQEGLLPFISSGVCDDSINQKGSDCAFSCTGTDGQMLPGAQDTVNEVIKQYLETCGANGTCLETTFDTLPQVCRDKYPLITKTNPYGWDQQYLCTNHDYGAGEKPFMCLDKNGGAPASLDCVATQCNAFLVRASPTYNNPCQPDTLSLANSCHDCDQGAAMNYGAGFSGYITAISAWCKDAPRCMDLSSGAKITEGACAAVEGGGGGVLTPASGQPPLTTTVNGTPTTIQPAYYNSTPTTQLTTISNVIYTLPTDGQPLTTTLPNGSILTLPPASLTGDARPTLSGQELTESGDRTANTAFASARPTSAARRVEVAKAAGLLMGLVVGFLIN